MATRLRKFSTSPVTKAIAFILAVLIPTGLVVLALFANFSYLDTECLFVEDYFDSRDFANRMRKAAAEVSDTLYSRVPPENVPYYYYVNDGKKVWSNVGKQDKSFFEQFEPAFCSLENGQWSFGRSTDFTASDIYIDRLKYYAVVDKSNTIYVAYPSETSRAWEQKWQKDRETFMPMFMAAAAGIVLLLSLAAYLAAVTGRKPHDRDLHPGKTDSTFSEILIAALLLTALAWYAIIEPAFDENPIDTGKLGTYHIVVLVLVGIITSAAATICGTILLTLIRKLKAGSLVKHSIIYKIFYRIYDLAVSLFDGRAFSKYPLTKSLFYRQLIFIILSFVFVFLTFLFIALETYAALIPPVLEMVMIYWYIKGNNRTYMDINRGFDESLEEQMKSERMKVALITNVSHDLKTPLTSIISYIDLLSKEEGLPETAKDYVKILGEKAGRLNNMVSDLFDLAKSTSGNMPVDIEKLDLKKLIEQTLADMGDRIEKSGLAFRVRLPEKPMQINADGKKLYRVFQNVIDNALKYSLQGTRVYVALEENEGMAVATVKNTAGYEMDFTADEILQRFMRGDKSRTTEGSGLGLSIAESYTKLCGGRFKVDIDGDLFKVTISFNLVS